MRAVVREAAGEGLRQLGTGLVAIIATLSLCTASRVADPQTSLRAAGHLVLVRQTGPTAHTILVDGQVLLSDGNDEFVSLLGPYAGGGRTYALIDENPGGNGCGGQLQAIDLTGTPSISPVFGNCNDQVVVTVRQGTLHVTTPSYRGPYSAGSPPIPAQSFAFRAGRLVELHAR